MNKNRSMIFVTLALSVVLLMGNYLSAVAQSPYQPILTLHDFSGNASWSLDSTQFAFQVNGATNGGVQTPTNTWYDYHSDMQQFTQLNVWPFQPILSQTQQTALALATNRDGQITFAFPSPNKRFLVYASKPIGLEFSLAIADLQSNTYVNVSPIVVGFLENFGAAYEVKWSADSTAFIVETSRLTGGPTETYYVTNFTNSLNARTVQPLADGIVFGNQTSYAKHVFAISDNGSHVLLEEELPNGDAIFAWNVQTPLQSQYVQVGGTTIIAAEFVPGSTQRIRFIGPNGLAEYDLGFQQTTILDANINSTWVTQGWFSPDASKLAILKAGASEIDLYIVNTSATGTPTQTPIPTVTSTLVPSADLLRTQVSVCVTDKGLLTSLDAKIDARYWAAFVNEVKAQSGKKITPDCANQLVQMATYLLNNSRPADTPEPTDHPDR